MPEQRQAPLPPQVDLERVPYRFDDQWSRNEALALVTGTFNRYSNHRHKDHDKRWEANDRLYHGWVPQRTWEGTDVPRSSLGIPVAFDQIETLFPALCAELFDRAPYWFEVQATHLSTPQEAAGVRAVLAHHLNTPDEETFLNPTVELGLAIHEMLQHGGGAVQLRYNTAAERLGVEWVPMKDLYFDPSLDRPFIDLSPSVIRRRQVTVEKIQALKGLPGYNVPPQAALNAFAKSKPHDKGDDTQRLADALRGIDKGGFTPLDPKRQTVELLEYWSGGRMIWVLNRQWVLTNQKNPMGVLPFCYVPMYVVTGDPFAMSIPDVVEGDQMLIQGIINARVDELSLALHPPRIMDDGDARSKTKRELAWKPGAVLGVRGGPGMIPPTALFPSNMTADAYNEVALAERRVQGRTGVNELLVHGTPTPSNANRSATGVATQAQAVNNRIRTPLKNIEDYLIVPLLNKAHRILSRFLPPKALEGVDPMGQPLQVPKPFFDAKVRFSMAASSRMLTQQKLMMILGPVTQIIMNESIHNALRGVGQTVDFTEFLRYFQDATNTAQSYRFFRPMNQEEAQVSQQPSPDVQAQLQAKAQELQVRSATASAKNETELQKTQLETESKERSDEERSAATILQSLMNKQPDDSDPQS